MARPAHPKLCPDANRQGFGSWYENVTLGSQMSEPDAALNNPAAGGSREQDLILSVQRGQHELFYELVRPYERRVYAAALAILRNAQDAEGSAKEGTLKTLADKKQCG